VRFPEYITYTLYTDPRLHGESHRGSEAWLPLYFAYISGKNAQGDIKTTHSNPIAVWFIMVIKSLFQNRSET
jgi:hypothetical protein